MSATLPVELAERPITDNPADWRKNALEIELLGSVTEDVTIKLVVVAVMNLPFVVNNLVEVTLVEETLITDKTFVVVENVKN